VIILSHSGIGFDGLWTFALFYVGLVGFFTWRVLRLLRTQRVAERVLRERLARRTALALRAQRPS
jgi:hypothetical protein